MNKNIILAILTVAVVALSLSTLEECHRAKSEKAAAATQLHILTDTLTLTRNRLGQETARTSAIVSDYATFRTFHFATTDSLGRALQRAVNSRTLSATVASQQLRVQANLATTQSSGGSMVLKTDSAGVKTLQYDSCRPTYTLVYDSTDPYRKGTIIAGADSFKVDLRFPETLTFSTEASPWSLIRPTTYKVSYTNSNPNVDITGLRSYTMECDCRKKSWVMAVLGFLAGNGTGFVLGRATK